MNQEVFVEGMKCEGCANTVKERFESLKGVHLFPWTLEGKKASVNTQSLIDMETFDSVLADTKYSVVEQDIKNSP